MQCQYIRCGKEIDPASIRGKRGKFCTTKCNANQQCINYRARRKEKNAISIHAPLPCAVCETVFIPYRRDCITCSPKCRRRLALGKIECVCQNQKCGKTFPVWGKPKKYCSRPCAQYMYSTEWNERHAKEVQCLQCHKSFIPSAAFRYYCSENCRSIAHLKPELKPKACKLCGAEFQPKHSAQVFCCDVCRKAQYESERLQSLGRLGPTAIAPVAATTGSPVVEVFHQAQECKPEAPVLQQEQSGMQQFIDESETSDEAVINVRCMCNGCQSRVKVLVQLLEDDSIRPRGHLPEGWAFLDSDFDMTMCPDCVKRAEETINQDEANRNARQSQA
jgi:hypothetical protein